MLSDIVCGGVFHCHIMTPGGTRATAARTAQLDGELKFPRMPAIHTPTTQTAARTVLIDTNGMLREYLPALNRAVH